MMHRLVGLWAVAFCCWTAAAPTHAQPATPTEEEQIAAQARDALWWGDFDELERQHRIFQQPGQRTAAGRSKLVYFRQGIDRVTAGPAKARELFFVQMDALTLHWTQAYPGSALAHVMHAEALSAHAWSHRGNSFSREVSPDAWREFNRYTTQAIDHLATHKNVVLASSSGHLKLLNLGRAAGWKTEAMWTLAQAGWAVNDDDDGLYRAMMMAVLPRWGGSPSLLDRTIGDIARLTAPRHGDIFYSRLYAWATASEFKERLFLDSGASWPRMKASYQQLLERYPVASNLNAFAYFACMARDKPTALDLLERIGAEPILREWGSSNASRTFETCKRWAAES